MKLLLVLMVMSVSCARLVNVYVESQSVASKKVSTFKVVPGAGVEAGLRFQEFASIASKALKQTGAFIEATENPETIIKLSYSISGPQKESDLTQNFVTGKYEIDSYNKYTRKVILKAYNQSNQEVWFTEIVSNGSGGDIKDMFPYLISAGIPFFGTTQARTFKRISKSESALSYLRQPASN